MRPYRKEKIANVIRQIVSEAIVHQLNDPRIAPMTTVTRVEMTKDLLVAKVFLSFPEDDPAVEQLTLRAMGHAGGFLQRLVAQGLSLRQCPELRFQMDEQLKKTKRMMALLAENRRREPELYESEDDQQTATEMDEDADEQVIPDSTEGVGE